MYRYKSFFFTCGLVMAVSEIWKQWCLTFLLGQGHYNWWHFPFQLCSIPMYICLMFPWIHSEKLQKIMLVFLMDYGLLGGIFAFFDTSGMHYSYFPLTVHSFTWHILLIILGLAAGFSQTVRIFSSRIFSRDFALSCLLPDRHRFQCRPAFSGKYQPVLYQPLSSHESEGIPGYRGLHRGCRRDLPLHSGICGRRILLPSALARDVCRPANLTNEPTIPKQPHRIFRISPAHKNGPSAIFDFLSIFPAASIQTQKIPANNMPAKKASRFFSQPSRKPDTAISLISPPPKQPGFHRQIRSIPALTLKIPATLSQRIPCISPYPKRFQSPAASSKISSRSRIRRERKSSHAIFNKNPNHHNIKKYFHAPPFRIHCISV